MRNRRIPSTRLWLVRIQAEVAVRRSPPVANRNRPAILRRWWRRGNCGVVSANGIDDAGRRPIVGAPVVVLGSRSAGSRRDRDGQQRDTGDQKTDEVAGHQFALQVSTGLVLADCADVRGKREPPSIGSRRESQSPGFRIQTAASWPPSARAATNSTSAAAE